MNMDEFNERLIRIEEHLKNDNDRLNKLELERAEITQLTIEMTKMTALTNQLMTKVDALNAKVDEMEKRPAKRWDSLVTAIIGAVVGIVIGFFVGR